jgi:hypothetical protein
MEVDRQIQGILPASDVLMPPIIQYELKERATVAKLLFQLLDHLNEDQNFHVRIQLVQALINLSRKQVTPHQFKHSKIRKQLLKSVAIKDINKSDHIASNVQNLSGTVNLFCAFCKWGDNEAGPRKRKHRFSRIDSLRRHVHAQHLHERAAANGFSCPYKGCSAYLGSATHFLSHTARQHDICL